MIHNLIFIRKRLCHCLLGAALLISSTPLSHALILPPTDDSSGTITYAGRPPVVTKRRLTSLNGSGTILPVSWTRTAFVRFAVEETGLSEGAVEAARVTLYFPTVRKAGDMTLHVVTEPWEETFTGTARNHPAYAAPFLTIPAASVISKQFVIIDVTSQVREWLANPGSNFGIAIVSPDGVVIATIGSKEGSASGYPPLLEIDATKATPTNTPNTLVKRDSDGNFTVGTITGSLVGNATTSTTAGSAMNFTGVLAGEVTGPQGATVVSDRAITSEKIATGAIANSHLVHSSLTISPGAGLSGGGQIDLGGSLTISNAGVLSLTGGGGITVNESVGAITLGSNATSVNTAGAIISRDANGDFSAGRITATSFVGDGSALTGLTPRFDRQERSLPGPITNNTTGYQDLLVIRTKNLGESGCYKITVSTGSLANSSFNAVGTFAVTVDFTDIATVEWNSNSSDPKEVGWTVIANNVPADSVIKFRFKQSFSGGTGIRVLEPRLTIDGMPQSYVVE
jgi:hypothetical protein